MEDSLAGKAVRIGVLQTLRLRPGFDILKPWQGKVEIALRSVAAVLAFVLIIPAGVTQTVTYSISGLGQSAYSAAGWLLFVTIMAMLIEGVIITLRFLNLGLIEKYIFPLVIADVSISFVVAVGMFVGATPMATYAAAIGSPAGATAAFGYFEMVAFGALGGWVLVTYFFMKWCVEGKYAGDHIRISEPAQSPEDYPR